MLNENPARTWCSVCFKSKIRCCSKRRLDAYSQKQHMSNTVCVCVCGGMDIYIYKYINMYICIMSNSREKIRLVLNHYPA